MRHFRLSAAIFLLLLFANLSWAQGTIEHTTAPKAGSCSGTIDFEGKITLDSSCWSVNGGSALISVWQDGGIVYSTGTFTQSNNCPPTEYTWTGTISGLKSNAKYNVTCEIELSNGCDYETIKTGLTTATTK